jgi:predicted DNA-binding transcriptional regulator YafY
MVHPLHLAEIDESWLLFAYDPALAKIRKFLLKRMSNLVATGAGFEPPPDFDARAEVEQALGLFSGDEDHELRLALNPQAVLYARDQIWHHTQQLADRLEGRVELTMRVNGLENAIHLAVRWGEHIEVLASQKLRESVKAALRGALAHDAA